MADRLRTLSMAVSPNTFIGSEDNLVLQLGAARGTVRQAARLVERDGLITVRRGMNGGYFSARPDIDAVEAVASAYLETHDIDPQDTMFIASLLWVEVIRKACAMRDGPAADLAGQLQQRLARLRRDAPFRDIVALESDIQTAMFDLTGTRYIELIFTINAAFARRRMPIADLLTDRPHDGEFLTQWRNAKHVELQAIADGDIETGAIAARYSRQLWSNRFRRDQAT